MATPPDTAVFRKGKSHEGSVGAILFFEIKLIVPFRLRGLDSATKTRGGLGKIPGGHVERSTNRDSL